MLYKTDIYNHRQKIRKIFNYIIGAQTSEQLLNEFEKQKLINELKDLLYKEAKEEKIREEVLINSELILDKAIEYGLIPNQTINIGDFISIEKLLHQVSQKRLSDIELSEEGDKRVSEKLQSTINKLDELNFELNELKQERNNIQELLGLIDKQTEHLNIKKERLEISRFIKSFCEKNKKDAEVLGDIESLCNNLEIIENQLINRRYNKNSIFEAKLAMIKEKISQKSKEFKKNNKIKEILEHEKTKKPLLEEVYVNIIGEAKNNLNRLNNNSDLNAEVSCTKEKIKELEFDLDANIKDN